jgi:hypothetical protein
MRSGGNACAALASPQLRSAWLARVRFARDPDICNQWTSAADGHQQLMAEQFEPVVQRRTRHA